MRHPRVNLQDARTKPEHGREPVAAPEHGRARAGLPSEARTSARSGSDQRGSQHGERVVVVRWPDWSVVAAGAKPGQAAAVLHANRVVAATPAARADGVVPGLRRREAQRYCPGLVILPYDMERDARAFEPVLRVLEQTTPLLEVSAPGCCTFATRGPSRYYGGDEALADRVAAHVSAAFGEEALRIAGPPQIGLADGAFAAWLAAARADAKGSITIVDKGASAAFLSSFSVSVLVGQEGIDDRFLGLLPQLGVRSLGQLAVLPRSDIAARFGHVGRAAHRLASGLEGRPLLARQPPPDLSVSCTFEDPVPTSGPVAFAAKQLADEMFERMRARGLACTQILVTAQTDHGEQHDRLWRHEPAFQPVTVAERVRWQLDGWAQALLDGPTAGITLLRIAPTEVIPGTGQQAGFWGGRSQADDRAIRGVARLVGQLGADAVLVPEWRGSRNPGDAVVLVSAASADLADRDAAVQKEPAKGPWPGVLPPPSPATVWAKPIAVRVCDASGSIVRVSGRGFVSAPPATFALLDEKPQRVVAWGGPWPIEEHWWDPQRYRRCARFHILLDSGEAHLIVVESGVWRLEATYD
jgi:protein ImuB